VTPTSATLSGITRLAHTGVNIEPVLDTGIVLFVTGLLLFGFATRRRTRAWILRLTGTH